MNCREPNTNDVHKRLSEAYDAATSGKDYEKGLRMIDEVLDKYPNMPDALRKKAAIYADMADFSKAMSSRFQ